MESNNEYILTCIGSFSRRDVAVKENHCNDERLLAIMFKTGSADTFRRNGNAILITLVVKATAPTQTIRNI